MPTTHIEPLEKEKLSAPGYSPVDKEKKVWDQYLRRKKEMMAGRRNVHGIDIDTKMKEWDTNYFNRVADIPSSELDPDQKPIAINNAFGKIQAALSILIDKNPEIVLDETLAKYSANRELIKALATSSWKKTNSLGQFKLSVFNAAKRGWFAGRTFNRVIRHPARFTKAIGEDGKVTYDEKEITKLDDIAYINLDNHNVWIDEEAKPEDFYSARDAMHREVWHIDKVKAMFPEKEFPNMKYVVEGGNTQETVDGTSSNTVSTTAEGQARELKKGMTEVFFYENQYDDWYIVEVHDVMIIWEPLPQDHKRLSYTWGYWNLRSAETIYGLGFIEMMERNEIQIDRIVNMNMRQLLLSINPGGFYTGPEDLENENIKIKAGVFRKTLDPKNITFLEVPPMKKEGFEVVEWMEGKEEQTTGMTKRLEGEQQEKQDTTAFEVGVSREASLKRLKIPLRSFQYALNWEFANRIDLIKQTYSDFQVDRLANEEDIMNYLEEVKADPDFYFIQNEGEIGREQFFVKKFREVKLNLKQDEKGNFIESEKSQFFKVKPEYLSYEGDVVVNMDSLLVQSEELEKADTMQMANLLIPLFSGPIEINLNPAREILKAHKKDYRKWFPQQWIDQIEGKTQEEKTEIPTDVRGMLERMKEGGGGSTMERPGTVVPPKEVGQPSLGQRFGAAFSSFRSGK